MIHSRFFHFMLDDLPNGSLTFDNRIRVNRSISPAQPNHGRHAQSSVSHVALPQRQQTRG